MTKQPNELVTATNSELIAELFSRFEHAIFAGMKPGRGPKDGSIMMRRYFGNTQTCCGLATAVQNHAMMNYESEAREPDGDESPIESDEG